MLKSYEALYENGQVTWLGEQPEPLSAHLIVTVLEKPQRESSSNKIPEEGEDNLAAKIEKRFADLGDFKLPEIPRESIKTPPDFTEI